LNSNVDNQHFKTKVDFLQRKFESKLLTFFSADNQDLNAVQIGFAEFMQITQRCGVAEIKENIMIW